jgi:hypothetical protein
MFKNCNAEAIIADVSSDEVEMRSEEVPEKNTEHGCTGQDGRQCEERALIRFTSMLLYLGSGERLHGDAILARRG